MFAHLNRIPAKGCETLMQTLVDTSINSYRNKPDESTVEMPVSELQELFRDIVSIHNLLAETLEEAGILRGRELAKLTKRNEAALKAERDPITKISLLNAFIKQHISRVREALKSRPAEAGKVIQVVSKIQARAIQIIDYIRAYGEDHSQGKNIALDSQQSRLLFSGKSGEPVSRRDTIRAMKRAEKLCPALRCEHRPNDGRKTMRLTAHVDDLKGIPQEIVYRDTRQRSGLTDLKVMFNLG